jgi:hypothetical protein
MGCEREVGGKRKMISKTSSQVKPSPKKNFKEPPPPSAPPPNTTIQTLNNHGNIHRRIWGRTGGGGFRNEEIAKNVSISQGRMKKQNLEHSQNSL